jgi:pimeloyl-ACP methyl ester carboxylesterase
MLEQRLISRHDRSVERSIALLLSALALASGCGDDEAGTGQNRPSTATDTGEQPVAIDDVVEVDGDRGLYIRCNGTGSPTVVMEGGDGDTSDSYGFAEPAVSAVTRVCVYDRANLGRSDPAPGPRVLRDLVRDLDRLLDAAEIPPPYVLVGTSGGGFITAGYAYSHPDRVAGMVFVDTGVPLENPPRAIVEETDPTNPDNVERRDYLRVEREAWEAREEIGDIPVSIISVEFSGEAIAESPFPVERLAMRRNVQRQKGWLVLSSRAKQIVARTGHAVEEEDPDLVVEQILDVVRAAQR